MGSNGTNGAMKLISWTGGIVALLITFYVQFHVPLANAIAQETRARQEKDVMLQENLNKAVVEQKDINKDILLALKEIQVDLRYIKKEAYGRN